MARYETVLDGDAGCVEALQQLALLCVAEGIQEWSGRVSLLLKKSRQKLILHEPISESAVNMLMQHHRLPSAGQAGHAEAYCSRLRRLTRSAALAPATAQPLPAQMPSSWPCGGQCQQDTACRSLGLIPAGLPSR